MKRFFAFTLCLFCAVAFSACTLTLSVSTTPATEAETEPVTEAETEPVTDAATVSADDRYLVTEEEWNALFDLKKMAFDSNYKISVSVPANDWEATISFDSGKIYVTGLGLRAVPDGEPQVEQRTDGYMNMKSASGNVVVYDRYTYWGGWTVEEREETLSECFMGYGLFEHRYSDFVFDEETKAYKTKSQDVPGGEAEEEQVPADEWTVRIVDKKIVEVEMSRGGAPAFYTYSDYGGISVAFPEIGD